MALKPKGVAEVSRLSGPEKAAVVLLALGEDHASVWRGLDEEEIKVISQAMAGLGQVTSQVVEDLLVEFVSGMGSGAITGSVELTQKLLASIMPEDKVDTLMEEIRGPAGRTMWDKLGNV
ncbi:MAG: flagellar motor switch protein FliG, partial [Phenylobacterium sp.]